ncbi:MAG TPA: hypothetical protein DCZ97_06055 [Syntrophus sp. (in: bacteria)]|nr:hypothetical protein [Syntrophus sp. (in: bacteria)]
MNLLTIPDHPSIIQVDRGFYLFDKRVHPERPTGRSRPQGGTVRRPGIRASGFEGEGANQGAVSRPEQSGGRVTATDK